MAQRPQGGTKYKQPDVRKVGEGVLGEDAFSINRGGSHIWVGKSDADVDETTTWTKNNEQ